MYFTQYMKKANKIILGIVILLIGIPILFISIVLSVDAIKASKYRSQIGDQAPTIELEGLSFRDLNKNGKLDPYEDQRMDVKSRVEDLLSQMDLEEKAGMMFINMIAMSPDGSIQESIDFSAPMSLAFNSNLKAIVDLKMNHFNILDDYSIETMANWYNNIQKLAERTRLGIPVTIATDPRHTAGYNPGANVPTRIFSRWPSPLGFGAIGDTAIMREFADIARQEYVAMGMRLALHPMADLATEPRWARLNGTFGEDAELSSKLTYEYILGFQGEKLDGSSVATMSKHFSGGGPQKDGEDAHFDYGKEQAYPGDNFDYHLIPFEKGVFPARSAQIMPYYGIPVGQTSEDVAFAFNKEIITGLLREKYGFDGVVCTDWMLLSHAKIFGLFSIMKPRPWGVEDISQLEQAQKIIEAGCDQFGGESSPHLVIELVKSGAIPEARVDESVRRLLRDKFNLGLFDNPYIDLEEAKMIVGNKEFVEKGLEAQRRSIVLLKNDSSRSYAKLPLKKDVMVYIDNIDPELTTKYANVVEEVEDADVILTRIATPYEPRGGNILESYFHQGSLEFNPERKAEILDLISQKPSIVGIFLDRAAVIPEISEASHGLLADFGADDQAFLDVVFGRHNPNAKLPIELPSSMEAVKNQKEDVPYDSVDPLYPFGFGLSY